MTAKKSPGSKGSWAGTVFYLAITAGHAWALHGFFPVAGLIFLSLIGGALLYLGLKKLIISAVKPPFKVSSAIFGLFIFGLGTLTLIPLWPDTLLLKTPVGWPILEDRAMLSTGRCMITTYSWCER